MEGRAKFTLGRRSGVDAEIGRFNEFWSDQFLFPQQLGGKGLGSLQRPVRIDQQKRLGWSRGFQACGGGVKTGGCVKALQYLVRRIPHFFEVYAANGLVAILGRTTCFVFQFTGNGQHGVARLFRGKATWRKTPEESIPGIGEFLPFTGLAPGGLPVCCAGHDELVQGLHAPAVLQKTHGQPIQQFRMTGRFAQGAEIIGRRHDALSQMMLPYAVYDDPGGKWVVFVRDPFGQGAATSRGFRHGLYFRSRLT